MSFWRKKITIPLWQAVLYIMVLVGLLLALLCCAVPDLLKEDPQEVELIEEVDTSPKPVKPQKKPEIIPPAPDRETEQPDKEVISTDTDSVYSQEIDTTRFADRPKSRPPGHPGRISMPHNKSIITIDQTIDPETLTENKSYYEGEHGTVKSELRKEEESFSEYLVTASPEGEKIASLEIARWEKGQVVKHARFMRNRLVVHELLHPENDKDLSEQVTEYTISNGGQLIKGKTYHKLR